MTADGWVEGDETWPWRPYLTKVVFQLNRKVVKLYGFSPCVMMTGQPPEAPDADRLEPNELSELHQMCAKNMRRQAEGMKRLPTVETFKRGDVCLVRKQARKSHKDLVGKGGMSYPAKAVIVRPSRKNETQYIIRWLTEGLIDNEQYGEVSKRSFGAWRLKLCETPLNASKTYHMDQEIIDDVMNDEIHNDSKTNGMDTSSDEEDNDDRFSSLQPHEEIAERAAQ
jgi:hypothetical protein